ncbi:LysM peptidoglycan-binding domain-containing protein [Arthrobacter sp. ISL-65]|uniref:C40 family peptidase n=1 Tax=Arthrobacter sp. ISL-65 TaxID=2819112 RepID=UPI001BE6328B|nr:LysM peptidoglycan-binding domain-containing protein [Arthrobacter sp. ISL-65]MBT2549030.1 LysM peptidoglycan-binding domain-containing protein [Arthrobacter sp. ISL-65]
MSRKSIPARHRATPTTSVALQGLSYSLKSNAASVAKPAAAAAVASGLLFGAGAPAHAGAYAPETPDAAAVQSVAGQALAAPTQAQAAPAVPAPAAPAPASGGSAVAGASHTVVPGDTLGAIAARHGVSLDTLLAENGLSQASVIYPGDQILIPGPGAAAAPAAPAAPAVPAAPAAPAVPEPAGMGIYNASASITPAAATAPAAAATQSASGVGAAIVASARAQLGATQDCTILVEQALRSVGKSVGDLAPTQFHQYGTPVSAPQPGDLMISAGHVGVYIGGGQAISSGMNGVNETIVHPASWLTGSTYVRVNA